MEMDKVNHHGPSHVLGYFPMVSPYGIHERLECNLKMFSMTLVF